MNIFVLDEDPHQAAIDQCNKHVVKMIVESTQMLCTALLLAHPTVQQPYRATHVNHPCNRWVCATPANAAWLFAHARSLSNEYTRRYGRRHKTADVLDVIGPQLVPADWRDHSPFVMAMPLEWQCHDIVTSYRAFYIAEKSRFARWAPRATPPAWWPFAEQQIKTSVRGRGLKNHAP